MERDKREPHPKGLAMTFLLFLAAASSPVVNAAPATKPVAAKPVQSDTTALNVPQPSGANRPSVDQITLPAAANTPRTNMSQISNDAKIAAAVKDAPESAIGTPEQTPELALYQQVAQVWSTIRQRGQQPTPELIAREIGPDQLTKFLGQIPNAPKIFGVDSDTLPLPKPGSEPLPVGAGIVVLPPQGS
jgi:hypothetical protein